MTTPVDNSAAIAASTPAAAMAASVYNCEKGSDTQCVTQWGAGSCCYMGTIVTAGTVTSLDKEQAVLGWPTAEGDSNTWCLDTANVVYYSQEDETIELTQFYTKAKFTGYCVRAAKLAATVSAAAVAIFTTSF